MTIPGDDLWLKRSNESAVRPIMNPLMRHFVPLCGRGNNPFLSDQQPFFVWNIALWGVNSISGIVFFPCVASGAAAKKCKKNPNNVWNKKIMRIFALRKRRPLSGCSSARLEYTSGGRVVAGSNPVIPTKRFRKGSQFEPPFFICALIVFRGKQRRFCDLNRAPRPNVAPRIKNLLFRRKLATFVQLYVNNKG